MHHVTFLDEGEEKSGLGLCLVQGKFQSGHVFPIKKKKAVSTSCILSFSLFCFWGFLSCLVSKGPWRFYDVGGASPTNLFFQGAAPCWVRPQANTWRSGVRRLLDTEVENSEDRACHSQESGQLTCLWTRCCCLSSLRGPFGLGRF